MEIHLLSSSLSPYNLEVEKIFAPFYIFLEEKTMAKKKKNKKKSSSRRSRPASHKKPSASAQKGPVMVVRTFAQFKQKILRAEKPAIVDFWAPWCVPCQAMAPIFEAAAEEHGDEVIFAKVNTEEAPAVAELMGIRSIPTLIAFFEGEVADVRIGVTSKAALDKLANKLKKKYQKAKALEQGADTSVEKGEASSGDTPPEGKEKKSFIKRIFDMF